jgi:N-acetylmuramoyl-L-alanine amidase
MLDLSPPGDPPAGELDGAPLEPRQLFQWQGRTYLDAQLLSELGLDLAFNTVEDLYQVVGLVHTVDFDPARASLLLRSLTPVTLDGRQVSDTEVMLVLYGGFIQRTEPIEFPDDPTVDKLGFKSQVELGRSFIFIHQPERTGFRVLSDALVGFSRVNFGNYFQVASYHKTSSGEISLDIQLGAAVTARHEIIPDPWRLVVDFPGALYEEATREIPVNIGRVERVRIGTPEQRTVRVVLDLTDRADYRVLTKDHGARYFIQLLPPALPAAAPSERRAGRTIMVDAGHGGSDPGAEGVIPGVWEAPLNLSISRMLTAELKSLGYAVLETRTSDRFVSLGQRADLANYSLPFIFVSVHSNSIDFKPEMSGIMTFHHPYSVDGPELAADIQYEVLRSTGAVDKGVRQADFFVLRETIVPSVLVECGFLTNYAECEKLTDPSYQLAVARGIARGIDRYVLEEGR